MLFGIAEGGTVIGLLTDEIDRLKKGEPIVLYENTDLTVVMKEEHKAEAHQ